MNEEKFREMVYYYWTSIVYCGSKNDNNKLRNTFEQQANRFRARRNNRYAYPIIGIRYFVRHSLRELLASHWSKHDNEKLAIG